MHRRLGYPAVLTLKPVAQLSATGRLAGPTLLSLGFSTGSKHLRAQRRLRNARAVTYSWQPAAKYFEF
jgi:hypothetical protein